MAKRHKRYATFEFMIDSRIREVGDVIESVADKSMEEWTEIKKK